jgi:hypothetical protein
MPPRRKINPWTLTKHNMKKQLSTIALAATAVFAATASVQAGEVTAGPAVAPSNASGPWSFSAEALYLKSHVSGAAALLGGGGGNFPDQDNEFGYRLALGYKAGDNLGLRFRFFDYESSALAPGVELGIKSYDLEAFDSFTLGGWNGEFSFGLRYLDASLGSQATVDGIGPVVGFELTRPLSGPLSVYAGGRTGLIFGDVSGVIDDSQTPIAELSLGLQYDFSVANTAAFVRVGIDAQNYESLADAGLFGGAVKVGFSF